MNDLMTVSNFMTTTKTDIADFAATLARRVFNGEIEASTVARFAKTLEELAKQINEQHGFKTALYEEINLYEGGKATLQNADFQIKAVGVRYDFTKCGDTEWDEVNAQMQTLTLRKAEIEKRLKGMTKPMCDPDSGAMVYPPSKSGGEQVVITIKK